MPVGNIEHCLHYLAPGQCDTCENGYLPSSDNLSCVATNGVIDICTPLDKVGSLQSFNLADCANYPTPIALSYTKIGCLEDERDGKLTTDRKSVV